MIFPVNVLFQDLGEAMDEYKEATENLTGSQ
jgi:hypothetical protein